jgi:hypothetical protein
MKKPPTITRQKNSLTKLQEKEGEKYGIIWDGSGGKGGEDI